MWQQEYQKIELSEHLENNLRQPLYKFMKKFVIPNIILINDNVLVNSLNLVAGYQNLLISFDIEFQNAIMKSKEYYFEPTLMGDNSVSFIREFGGILFLKGNNKWYYLGKMLFNFANVEKYKVNSLNIRLTHSKYSTVTEETKEKMMENEKVFNIIDLPKDDIVKNWLFNNFYNNDERKTIISLLVKDKLSEQENNYINKKLQNISFNTYGIYLNKWYQNVLKNQQKLYYNDKLVKQRILNNKDEHEFLDLFSVLSKYTYFVVKGKRDMEAITNSQMLIKNKSNIKFKSIYDIEIFNKMSQNIYGNAQLETTFNGLIKTNIYKEHFANFFDPLLSGDAHNPMTDSLWTVVVALCIANGTNEYLSDKNNYTIEYEKYKRKYIELKNQNRRQFAPVIE